MNPRSHRGRNVCPCNQQCTRSDLPGSCVPVGTVRDGHHKAFRSRCNHIPVCFFLFLLKEGWVELQGLGSYLIGTNVFTVALASFFVASRSILCAGATTTTTAIGTAVPIAAIGNAYAFTV